MFKAFSSMVNYSYQPKKGKTENIFHFMNLCKQVKVIVEQDQALLQLHHQRIINHQFAYTGDSIHLLVQDIIYASTQHFKELSPRKSFVRKEVVMDRTPVVAIQKNKTKKVFQGKIINHLIRQKKNKRIGDLGELFVLQEENKKLKSLKKMAEHVAITQGDGLGYDIESFDEKGRKMFIEVKTTTQRFSTPFFVTRTELERSKKEGDNYFLYRVYNFDLEKSIGEIHVIQGSMEDYCLEPENYQVRLKKI